MIASKQIAFGTAARGNKLPNGVVPIEYLESTGTQWIDTQAHQGTLFKLGFKVSNAAGDIKIFGNRKAYPGRAMLALRNSAFRDTTIPVSADTWYDVELNSTEPPLLTVSSGGSTSRAESWFGWNVGQAPDTNYGTGFPFVGWIEESGINYNGNYVRTWINIENTMSISYFKAYDGETLILDLIPVRKGNIGCMYDRVSGQLFGNQGSGEFVLGPDIIDYTAKDYIQDGLVAMWDGIENAGWGVHDPSATVWKDLVGERDIAPLNGNTFDDDSLFISVSNMGKVIPTKDIANSNSQLTYEIGGYTTDTGQSLAVVGDVTGFRLNAYPKWGESDIYVIGPTNSGLTLSAKNGGPYVRLTFALTYDGETAILYLPRDMSSKSKAYTKNDDTLNGEIAKYNQHIHFIRIYSRALTAEEIAHNYEIDKARFGL